MPSFGNAGIAKSFCRFSTPNLNRTELVSQASLLLKWSETIQIHHFFCATLGGILDWEVRRFFFKGETDRKKNPTGIDLVCSLFQRISFLTPKYLQLLNTHPLFTTRNVLSLTAKTERCLLWTWAGTIRTADSSQLHFNPWPCLYSSEVGWGTVKPGWFTLDMSWWELNSLDF